MHRLISVSFAILVVVGLYSIQDSKNSPKLKVLPITNVRADFGKHLSFIQQEIKVFNTIDFSDKNAVESQFLQLRSAFKEVEFLLSYIDPQVYTTYLNGAPLPKVMKHVPDVTIIEPSGLQRMEELVYDDEIDQIELKKQLSLFEKQIVALNTNFIEKNLSDPIILEAIRYGLIRVYTMGVTGFDSPGNTDKSLLETATFLKGMQSTMQHYYPFMSEEIAQNLGQLFNEGINDLTTSSFENFDRAAFLKYTIDPLWKITLEAQKALYVELPMQRQSLPIAINYEASSLFDNEFINRSFYSDYQLEGNREFSVELGKILFFDPVLSSNGKRACASCHRPEKGFTDGLPKSLETETMNPGKRNSPTVMNSLLSTKYFYDIRTDRLSQQMDHVVFNPTEFGTNYDKIVSKLKESDEYIELFTSAYGGQGITKNTVTNAVASYVGSLTSYDSDFDKYMRGESDKISKSVLRGYNLFTGKAACATCHFAPTFSGNVPPYFDETETEVLGVPSQSEAPYTMDEDLGRYDGSNIFERVDFYKFSFKTPTLRNIELTGPYMHNGVYETLEEVVEFYNNGGGIGLGLDVPHQTLPGDSLNLSKREQKDLIAFMKSLTDTTGLTAYPTELPSFQKTPLLNNRKIGGEY